MNNPMAGMDPSGYRARGLRTPFMGNGPCMGDIDCEMDQTFSGPVSDFRNSVGSGGAPKSAWNGREKSSVVSSKYEAIVEVGGITYYNEHFGAGDTNDRAEDKKSGERSLDIVGATERSEGASNTFRIKTADYQASKPQENFVDFTIRAGQLLVSHADRTGFEHCYRVCGSDSPGTQGKPDFEAKIVTIESLIEKRKPDLELRARIGPATAGWMRRIEALPYFARTWPSHWT